MNGRLFIVFLSFALIACAAGKDDKKKSSTDAPEATAPIKDSIDGTDPAPPETVPDTPVLAFFGGYTSCGAGDSGDPNDMDLKKFFDATLAALTTKLGTEPKYLISCYTLDYENAYYRVSGDDQLHEKRIAGMENAFEDLLASVERPKVLLVGHSYGGWTAMDMALKLPDSVTLAGLVTLDPISHENCTVNDFLSAQLGGSTTPGCLEPPSDFGDDGVNKIGDKAKEWLNYYQTQVSFLHSGEIKPAKNFKRPYSGSGFAPHNGFLFDDDIGKEILDLAVHSYP